MNRQEKNILKKVLSLIRGIRSQEPADGVASRTSFYYRTRADLPFDSGEIVQRWLTKKAQIDSLDIARMAMSYDLILKDGDQKTFSSVIMSTLQKNAGNIELFNGGSFFSKHDPTTLFDARKIKHPQEFAQKLWEVIQRALLESMTECLVLYPLPRIKSRLFSLGFDGISLIPADGNKAWQDLHEKYRGIRLWEPLTGDLRGGQKIPHSIAQYRLAPPLTWLAYEIIGTKDGSLKHSKKMMSKFLSALFSHLIVRKPQILDKLLVDIPSPIFRFLDQKLRYSFTSPISYLLRDDLEILEEDFECINCWYTEYRKISEDRRKKVELCTLSIQKAMVNRNEIEFIYYFHCIRCALWPRIRCEKQHSI